MSTKHKLTVSESLSACEVVLLSFATEITFTWHGESGDGWNEPRSPAHPVFQSVRQIGGPTIAQPDLDEWASEWLDQNADRAHREMLVDHADWEERRSEERADMARTDRTQDEEPF